jgi:hypothetical protein
MGLVVESDRVTHGGMIHAVSLCDLNDLAETVGVIYA